VVRRDKVKVSEITALRDDLALALAARTVRIEAPVPGRAVIGLEIPNSTASVVGLRKVVETAAFQKVRTKSKLAMALGQDVSGGAVAADLAKMPHVLIAGATGSGKSVCMNAIITGFLLQTTPDELRMVMIDPKRVELTAFRDVPHLLRSVVVDSEQAVTVLKWVMQEMETRLRRFEAHSVRNIDGYNRLMGGGRDGRGAMPYIVVLIDELADLMMTAPDEVERSICRLAQLARATGIHLVIATQRPSVDVVTGLIKANFPTRISFAVASQVDSRTILDSTGAEQLLGSGDMLYMPSDAAKPRRLQGVFVADEEVKRVVDFWKKQGPPQYVQELEEARAWSSDREEQLDPMYDKAVEITRQHTRVSASLLQRRLGVGYNRAARLVDLMEERGVVGAAEGGKPREVLFAESAADNLEG
jgi:S-DNA-T family DNA segregation ATPase FtsK/SpoIIIE